MKKKTETLSDKVYDGKHGFAFSRQDVKSSVQKILAKIDEFLVKTEASRRIVSEYEESYSQNDIKTIKEIIKQEMGEELVK